MYAMAGRCSTPLLSVQSWVLSPSSEHSVAKQVEMLYASLDWYLDPSAPHITLYKIQMVIMLLTQHFFLALQHFQAIALF